MRMKNEKSRLYELTELGQEVWHDDLYRELILEGTLRSMVDRDGLSGLTSNPTIFENAIKRSPLYAEDISRLCRAGVSRNELYDELMIKDIRLAAEVFADLHEESGGAHGHVCIEVDPRLSYVVEGTVDAVRDITERVNVDNLLIKVGGTERGAEAIEALIAEGYNINVTLLFSVSQYRTVAEAYLRGIERRVVDGADVSDVHSVASFFLSRIDTEVDQRLDHLVTDGTQGERERAASLKGEAAIAVGKLVYRAFQELFNSERSRKAERGSKSRFGRRPGRRTPNTAT